MELFDEEAEKIFLGSILQFPFLWAELELGLSPDDLYFEKHRVIYRAILDLLDQQQEPEAQLLVNTLKEKGELEKAGGKLYILEIVTLATQIGITKYVRRIRELSLRRNFLHILKKAQETVFDRQKSVQELLSDTERQISMLADQHTTNTVQHIRELAPAFSQYLAALREKKGITGIATHFRRLDELTGGFRAGQMIVLAARPGVGKSTFALNIAHRIAVKENRSILIFSLEMTKEELLLRMVCAEALLESQKIMKGYGSKSEIERLGNALYTLAKQEIYIDESSDLTSFDFKLRSRRLANKLKIEKKPSLGLIVVDYLQLMTDRSGHESRQVEVAAISRSIKLIAKELEVPVLAVSQMNRAIEQRGREMRPQLSDLRESGAIEQDADIVIFLHREELYNPDTDKKGVAEVIVAKHRGGPTDRFELIFQKNYNLFLDPDLEFSSVVSSSV
ncbi:MAG: replicative DNA helicase [Leptospiraceae bacterium]|nr:replicative DNA helicase [Leptospiraceae bacterium]MDW8307600.1 replicative DNA helicase [Leptospiraceae bacterium]